MARIWIGDSRGVGMEAAVGTGTDTWIVKGAMSYNWFKNTALLETKTKLSSNPVSTVIIMMGVNDCANQCVGGASTVESYISDVNALVSTYPLAKIFFCAVNPVDGNYPSSYHSLGYIPKSELNTTIQEFNSRIRQNCRAKYLDTYSYLTTNGFSTSDGIHYTSETYKKLHSWICQAVLTGSTQVAVQYQPRTTCPDKDDVWWIRKGCKNSKGEYGKNPCIAGSDTLSASNKSLVWAGISVLPNCVGYAHGRFSEILGETAKLSAGNAENWWAHTSDGYERGQTPRLGAVICWQRGATLSGDDGAGHVAVVEKINDDGSILTSESGWGSSNVFWTTTRTNSNGRWGAGSDYTFQGFIYNPKAGNGFQLSTGLVLQDALYYFLEEVNKGIGTETTLNSSQYIKACAETVGNIIDTVIPNAVTPRDIAEQGVKKEYGKWLIGPANIDDEDTEPAKPYPGDLALIRTVVKERYSEYSAERIAVVTSIIEEGTKFTCVYVNTSSDKVIESDYRIDSDQIAGYYRPHWELIGASVLHLLGYAFGLSVYTEISGKDDATLREVSYLNSQLEPSIISSNLKLSVINYTSGISALFLAVGTTTQMWDTYDSLILTGFTSIQCAIIEQLMSYGLNAAIAMGILGNIEAESDFRLDAVGDNGTSFGLCQWHDGRGAKMKEHCGGGDAWKTNCTGQISWLWVELNGSENATLRALEGIPNTRDGAMDAAEVFVRKFERPEYPDEGAIIRRANAAKYWDKAVGQLT